MNQNGKLCKISQAIYLFAVSAIAECYFSTLPSTHICVYIKYMRRSRSRRSLCVWSASNHFHEMHLSNKMQFANVYMHAHIWNRDEMTPFDKICVKCKSEFLREVLQIMSHMTDVDWRVSASRLSHSQTVRSIFNFHISKSRINFSAAAWLSDGFAAVGELRSSNREATRWPWNYILTPIR